MSAAPGGAAVAAVREAVAASGLLPASGGRVLLLCSGGRDSRCLLHVAAELCGPQALTVVHVDHGLRAGSSDEGELVRGFASAAGVRDVRCLRAGAPPASGNLQDWARQRRRDLAASVAAELMASGAEVVVATAHTQTDLVETALGRFATQPGRRALLGLAPRAWLPAGDGEDGPPVALVRPLLGVSRAATAAYCLALGLSWLEDPSNADARFARARLRHEVLPVLRALNPQADAAIARTLAELREESEALAAIVDAELGGASGVSRARLAQLPPALARLVLRELCERAVGRPVPQAMGRLADVLALPDGGELDLGAGARVRVARGAVTCGASRGPAAPRQ